MMSEITKKKQYLPIIAASCVLAAIGLMAEGQQVLTDANPIAAFIGMGVGIMLFPLIFTHFLGNTAGLVAFVIFASGYTVDAFDLMKDEQATITSESFLYKTKGCEFATTFPSKPTIKIFTNPQIGDYEEAFWLSKDPAGSTVLRAECVPMQLNIDKFGAKNVILNMLATFAKDNGLSSVSYRYKLEPAGPTGYARGVKYAAGNPITSRIVLVVGENSFLTLYALGLSATFPQREVSPFLDSVRRVN